MNNISSEDIIFYCRALYEEFYKEKILKPLILILSMEANAFKVTIKEFSIPLVLFAFTYFSLTLRTELGNLFAFISFISGIIFVGILMDEIVENGKHYRQFGYRY